jgi:hypothetical protein
VPSCNRGAGEDGRPVTDEALTAVQAEWAATINEDWSYAAKPPLSGGRYWDRTSDRSGVNRVLSR